MPSNLLIIKYSLRSMVLLFCLVSINCSGKIEDDKTFMIQLKKIHVGMNYNEVEDVLGKPYEIKRGITTYQMPEQSVNEDSMPDTIRNDPRYIRFEPEKKILWCADLRFMAILIWRQTGHRLHSC
jgi:hypothetical protein